MKIRHIQLALLSGMVIMMGRSYGQENKNNILEQENERMQQQWNTSGNSAGLLLDKPVQNSSLEAGYAYKNGNLRRPQDPLSSGSIFLNTSGNLYLKDYYVQGYFEYKRNEQKDVKYNASIIDPFRGMPYILADTNASTWLNQHYKLGFKVATPTLQDKWSLGLAADYDASSGAKQRDIRAENYFYSLDIKPSVVYSLSSRHHLGAHFNYRSFKEQATNSNVNTYVNQPYYVLFGLGNAINYVGAGRTYNYLGDALGGGVQYQYQGSVKLFAQANYLAQAEDANISFTNTRPGGSVLMKVWKANINIQKSTKEFTHIVDFSGSLSNAKGIEYITQFENNLESDGYYVKYRSVRSKYNRDYAHLKYDILKPKAEVYDWKAGLIVSYDKLHDSYLIPASNMLIENLSYGASMNKAFGSSEEGQATFAVGANIMFKTNMRAEYRYSGSDANEVTVTELEEGNFQFYKANWKTFEVPLTYSRRLEKHPDIQVFAKASGQFIFADSDVFDNRKSLSISFGATF